MVSEFFHIKLLASNLTRKIVNVVNRILLCRLNEVETSQKCFVACTSFCRISDSVFHPVLITKKLLVPTSASCIYESGDETGLCWRYSSTRKLTT